MGLFSRTPSTTEKNDIKAVIARAQTCARNLNDADKIASFFKEWDRLVDQLNRLIRYENSRIKFQSSPKRDLEKAIFNKSNVERKCIDRQYADLNTSLLSLRTIQGKRNRVQKFFEEMEYFMPRMEPVNVDYVKQLKDIATAQLSQETHKASIAQSESTSFCPNCGKTVAPNSNFCSYCGNKLS